jgi:hypothetical protein
MKSTPVFVGLLAIACGIYAESADLSATDPVTRLPLPGGGAPVLLFGNPNKMEDVPICKSTSTMNFYTGRSGTVSAAVTWYASHLPGFKHVHGIGSGRSQDTFYNSGGTLIVAITGDPGQDGQDTKVRSVIYGTIRPGVSDKVIAGMNVQKIVCP